MMLILYQLFFLLCINESTLVPEKFFSVKDLKDESLYSLSVQHDPTNDNVIISLKGNKQSAITITGVAEICTSSIVNNHFLKLEYRIRAGSGIHCRKTGIYQICNGMLYNSLYIRSQYIEYINTTSESNVVSKTSYHISLKIVEQEKIFSLILTEHLIGESKRNRKTYSPVKLRLNLEKGVFYTDTINLTGKYTFRNKANHIDTSTYKNQKVYVIKLNGTCYMLFRQRYYVSDNRLLNSFTEL
ncbi:hypothetical protein [Xanthocytophaga agilis]|uniref:Uncharacterized protein n=1 Tax=Xanthocytophaga agilis TaxID=3048010 RepID=A0AAE3REI8_9BACT|nr:hypothetical protein [Xanthocytophaga agilis]MDJ1506573.1 hypothetical protein [Xanthocytophaga agilis]